MVQDRTGGQISLRGIITGLGDLFLVQIGHHLETTGDNRSREGRKQHIQLRWRGSMVDSDTRSENSVLFFFRLDLVTFVLQVHDMTWTWTANQILGVDYRDDTRCIHFWKFQPACWGFHVEARYVVLSSCSLTAIEMEGSIR